VGRARESKAEPLNLMTQLLHFKKSKSTRNSFIPEFDDSTSSLIAHLISQIWESSTAAELESTIRKRIPFPGKWHSDYLLEFVSDWESIRA
jgi:hypothetical protein